MLEVALLAGAVVTYLVRKARRVAGRADAAVDEVLDVRASDGGIAAAVMGPVTVNPLQPGPVQA